MALQLHVGIGVEFDVGGLSGAHVGELGFLEVRVDIGAMDAHERKHRHVLDHLLPGCRRSASATRRLSERARRSAEIELRGFVLGLGCGDLRVLAGNGGAVSQLCLRLRLARLAALSSACRLLHRVLCRVVRGFGGEALLPQLLLTLEIALCEGDVLARLGDVRAGQRSGVRKSGDVGLGVGDCRLGLIDWIWNGAGSIVNSRSPGWT